MMTTAAGQSTLEHRIGATGRFHLRLLSGEITLRGVDDDAVRVTERGGKSIAESFRVEKGDGTLSLTAPDRFGLDVMIFGFGRRSSLDLEVEVPHGADVAIETASAELDASDLRGLTRVRTASGEVSLAGLGGILEVDSVSGDVSISAVAALDLRVRTISGECAVRAPQLGRAVIETTSGDVRLDALLAGRGPFEIQTVSGDATIVGRSGLRVEARTITGELRSDLPHRRDASPGRKQLMVGDGGAPVAFKSVSGDLRVVAPRDVPDALPTSAAGATQPDPPVPSLASSAPEPPDPPVGGVEGGAEAARLDILHALERGELSVEGAMERLDEIEEA